MAKVFEAIQRGEFTGIVGDLPNEQYHASPGLSFSGLKVFSVLPAFYPVYLKRNNEQTSSQELGTLVHMATLEPELFASTVMPVEGSRASKVVKEQIADLTAQGKYVVRQDNYDLARRMSDSILDHPVSKELLSGGQAEQSVFVRDEEFGILKKCRPDYLRAEDGIIADIKFFNDLSDSGLEKQIFRMKYHFQSAWYLDCVGQTMNRELNLFAHIFVSDEEPYPCRIIVLNDAALEKARYDYRPLLPNFKQCLDTNNWPGYPAEVAELGLPSFAW